MGKVGYVYQVDFDCPECAVLTPHGERCHEPVDPKSGSSHYCEYHRQLTIDRAMLHRIIFERTPKQTKKTGVK